MCYLLNAGIGSAVYLGLSRIFPPEGLGISEPWEGSVTQTSGLETTSADEFEKHEDVTHLEYSASSSQVC